MAVAFGKVNAFNPSQDEWPLYVKRLKHIFVANGITDGAKKQAVFLSVIGASNYKLLSSLVAPVKPGEKNTKPWWTSYLNISPPLLQK